MFSVSECCSKFGQSSCKVLVYPQMHYVPKYFTLFILQMLINFYNIGKQYTELICNNYVQLSISSTYWQSSSNKKLHTY